MSSDDSHVTRPAMVPVTIRPPGPSEAGQARLLAAIRANDRKALAQFVAAHADELYTYLCSRMVPRVHLAEDLLQEVFISALEGIGRLRDPAALRSWLFGIARHKVEDHYRARLREPQPLAEVSETEETPLATEPALDDWLDEERLNERTQAILGELPETYRTVLLWRYWEARSAREMAQQTGRTEKAVERLLARARAQFKKRWTER